MTSSEWFLTSSIPGADEADLNKFHCECHSRSTWRQKIGSRRVLSSVIITLYLCNDFVNNSRISFSKKKKYSCWESIWKYSALCMAKSKRMTKLPTVHNIVRSLCLEDRNGSLYWPERKESWEVLVTTRALSLNQAVLCIRTNDSKVNGSVGFGAC